MSDLIEANIEELRMFVDTAQRLQDSMRSETDQINRQFANIAFWEDVIKDRVEETLQHIRREEEKIFDVLDELYRDVDKFSDALDNYIDTQRYFWYGKRIKNRL